MPYRETRRELLVFLALVVLQVLLISIQVPGTGRKSLIETGIFKVFAPLQKAFSGVVDWTTGTWQRYARLGSAQDENDKLKKEIFFLRQEKIFLQEKLKFHTDESEMRKNLEKYRSGLLSARIVGADPANLFQTVVIDKGSMDGVVRDMAVCDMYGNLVGRVVEPIGFHEAMVQMITDKDSGVSVISDQNRLIGLASGRSQYLLEVRYVLASSPPGVVGEEMFTTGFDGIYGPGMRVGRILRADSDPDNPIFQRIMVQPDFRFNELKVVGLIPPVSGGTVK